MDRRKGWRWFKNRVKRHKDQIRHGQCPCCSNPRRNPWYSYTQKSRTLPELKAEQDYLDQLKEL
jgi:hypothetical protein